MKQVLNGRQANSNQLNTNSNTKNHHPKSSNPILDNTKITSTSWTRVNLRTILEIVMRNLIKVNKSNKKISSSSRIMSMAQLIHFLRIMAIVAVAISINMMSKKISCLVSINFLSLMMIFWPVVSLEGDLRIISLEYWINMVEPKMPHILSNLKANIESITMVSLHQDIEWLKKTQI